MAIAKVASITSHCAARGLGRTRKIGHTTRPMPASAIGNSTKTGRLNVVSASKAPSQTNPVVRRSWNARTATHIETVNQKVVQTSVITSAPKYGIGGKTATSAAAPSATRSGTTRRAIAYTTRQIAANASVCAKATGH
jgi:hypothetical protein